MDSNTAATLAPTPGTSTSVSATTGIVVFTQAPVDNTQGGSDAGAIVGSTIAIIIALFATVAGFIVSKRTQTPNKSVAEDHCGFGTEAADLGSTPPNAGDCDASAGAPVDASACTIPDADGVGMPQADPRTTSGMHSFGPAPHDYSDAVAQRGSLCSTV